MIMPRGENGLLGPLQKRREPQNEEKVPPFAEACKQQALHFAMTVLATRTTGPKRATLLLQNV